MSADPIALGDAPRGGTPDALIHALGYAGLLPFAGLAALVWLVPAEPAAWVAMALTTYAVLLACYLVDRKLYPPANLSRWLTLRWRLSAVAALSCFVAAGAV